MDKLKAYSKVNLILKIFPQKQNEIKHKIHSLFCLNKTLFDYVEIQEDVKISINFKQNNRSIKIDKTKILLAIQYLSKLLKRKLNLNIVVHKCIPLMSGLGGSATDIATVMKWILKKYHFKLQEKHLKYIALNIGSDIPFFLSNYASAWVSEYGNKVLKNNKPIPKFKIILSNIPIDTTKVYQKMMRGYISRVNIKQAYKTLNKNLFSHHVIYNDMWFFANELNTKLALFSRKLLKTKKVILSGSGGSFVEIK